MRICQSKSRGVLVDLCRLGRTRAQYAEPSMDQSKLLSCPNFCGLPCSFVCTMNFFSTSTFCYISHNLLVLVFFHSCQIVCPCYIISTLSNSCQMDLFIGRIWIYRSLHILILIFFSYCIKINNVLNLFLLMAAHRSQYQYYIGYY